MNYSRRKSSEVHIGTLGMGGNNPIRIQTMANVSTMDTGAAIEQAVSVINAGAELVRFTAQGEREAINLGEIRKGLQAMGYSTPLVADIHFNPRAADEAARQVQKVRINPGNYVDKIKTFDLIEYTDEEYTLELQKIRDRFVPFLNICKANHTAIRIGVNHGSLSDRIMSRYGDTPEGMVASCMEFLRICVEEDFPDVVISIKASNTVVMVETVRLLVQQMDSENMFFPLHLGVTEAGDGEDGRIKSAVGIGTLLHEGIGDTIRVSLSEDPEKEIPVAGKLIHYVQERMNQAMSCEKEVPGFSSPHRERRESLKVGNIGGGQLPVVIASYRPADVDTEADPACVPDYLYIGTKEPDSVSGQAFIVDYPVWKPEIDIFPCFNIDQIKETGTVKSTMKFLQLTYDDLTPETLEAIKEDPLLVILLKTGLTNRVGYHRAALSRLLNAGCQAPVILMTEYDDKDIESLQIKAGADLGALILDGFQDGIFIQDIALAPALTVSCMFGVLQATRTRISKTEYISCPGCGRTLYNLQSTIARVKEATSHLKGLKIGIMGCIVNGPGEMADADYGYVGAGRGMINLYKGKTCVLKNIPEKEAVERLIQLIKENGDWQN